MRATTSKFVKYIGILVCPKCAKKGYGYIKRNFDSSEFIFISHRHCAPHYAELDRC